MTTYRPYNARLFTDLQQRNMPNSRSKTPKPAGKNNDGALDGGPQCRLSILRNDYVPCRYFRNVSGNFEIA